MSILKRFQILVLVLVPTYFVGMNGDSVQEKNWIQEALACPCAGAWTTLNKNGKTVIIEGELISKTGRVISSEADVKKVASMFADIMQGVFVESAKASRVVWLVTKLQEWATGKNYRDCLYDELTEDMSDAMLSANNDLWYIFTVSDLQNDGTKTLLGAALFDIKKDYAYGTVELDLISVTPEGQGRSLSTILAGAIFNFLPQIKRIILDVLSTNKKAIDTYVLFGFTKYAQEHNFLYRLVDPEFHYEYLTELPTCQKLQAACCYVSRSSNLSVILKSSEHIFG
ncbi:MAG: GNAT family N-acetyltransferase [bacterium]